MKKSNPPMFYETMNRVTMFYGVTTVSHFPREMYSLPVTLMFHSDSMYGSILLK